MTTILTKDVSIPYNWVNPQGFGQHGDECESVLELKAGEEFYFWKDSETEISWGEYREFVGNVDATFWNSIEEI